MTFVPHSQSISQGDEPGAEYELDRDALYRTLAASSPVGIFHSDVAAGLTYANPRLEQIFGVDERELRGAGWLTFVHDDDRGGLLADWAETLAASGEFEAGYRVRRRDGTVRHLCGRAAALRDTSGTIVGTVGTVEDVTERHRAEEALRDSEERFRVLVEQSAEAVFVLDEDGIVRYASPSLVAMLGYAAGDVLGTSGLALVHPDDLAHAMAALHEGFATPGRVVRIEYRLRDAAGDYRLAEACGRAIRDERTGGLIALVTVRDVTERRAAEAALRASEARSRAHLEAAHEGIAIVDAVGCITYANPRLGDLLGYATAELARRRIFDFMDPAVAFESRTRFARAQRGIAEAREVPMRRRDGSVVWTRKSVSPVFGADGTLESALFLFSDVTERRRAEQATRESEARFRALIEHAHDMVVVIDGDGVTRYASPSFEAQTGHALASIVGGSGLRERAHPEDQEVVWGALARVTRGGRGATITLQFRYRHADGHWMQLSVTAANLLEEPAVRGIVLNVQDVSQRARLEAQLRQAQKMEAVGQLAGGVAHDFNNLLTIIEAHGGFLAEELPPLDPRREHVDEIARATGRAASLTRQLLAFSRNQVLRPRRLDLDAAVDGVAKLLRRVIGEDVALEPRLAGVPLTIEADPGQLEQVLMNLAVNARDAMPDGGTLAIATRALAVPVADPRGVPAGHYAALTVADTGVGMDAATQSRIFEPFFTTKEPGKGTGLGLATVYGIVEQSGGHVRVESAPGQGTTFEILLPLVADAPEPSESAPAPVVARGTETVLLCEDEDGVRATARRALERRGYRVLDARTGEDALWLAGQYRGEIPLLVTDAVMPGMSGGELAAALRRARPGMRVLFISGYTEDRLVRLALDAERAQLLEKPFAMDELGRRVREALDA